jgi:hypothetical protein
MTLPTDALSYIQQAGQALHDANTVLAKTMQVKRDVALANVLSDDGEVAYRSLQFLAKLNQELESMEEKLRELYWNASQPASNMPLFVTSKREIRSKKTLTKGVASLAVSGTPPIRMPRRKKILTRENLSKNSKKVLDFLESSLSKDEFTAFTLHAIADGAGIPPGSVPESLARVLSLGSVVVGGRGQYKIA